LVEPKAAADRKNATYRIKNGGSGVYSLSLRSPKWKSRMKENTMSNPADMKLPDLEQRYVRGFYFPREYTIDPAVLKVADEAILPQIVAIQLDTLSKIAAVEAEGLKAMADVLRKSAGR
jgi:hypothetical protein